MPAVTVDDVLALPRLPGLDRAATATRPVLSVTTAPEGLEGEGFPVRRAFAGVDRARLDPFVHMDQMGEVEYAPGEPKGTPWHPHRGFETVTYMIDGTFRHQDSIGGGGLITNGDTQWMTAGAGILHIEAPPEELVASGGLFHGIQLWVNLPRAEKMIPPRYQDIGAPKVALVASPDGGALLRIIAGEVGGYAGPGLDPFADGHGARHRQPRRTGRDPVAGGVQCPRLRPGGDGTVGERWPSRDLRPARRFRPGRQPGGGGRRRAGIADTRLDVLVLGGRPIGEPVYAYGPFVMNTRDEVAQAFEDYQAGRLGTIPAEHIA